MLGPFFIFFCFLQKQGWSDPCSRKLNWSGLRYNPMTSEIKFSNVLGNFGKSLEALRLFLKSSKVFGKFLEVSALATGDENVLSAFFRWHVTAFDVFTVM